MSGPSLSSQPRTVRQGTGIPRATDITAAGTYVLKVAGNPTLASNNNARDGVFYVVPDDWALYNKLLFFQLEVEWATGDTPPAADCYATLFPVTNLAGSAAASTIVLGTETTGARTPERSLSAGNAVPARDVSGPFSVSASGLYVVCMVSSAAWAANSYAAASWRLSAITR